MLPIVHGFHSILLHALLFLIVYMCYCICFVLQLYSFGETVSIVFWTDTWKPESFFDKIEKNRQNGMHTLCLLGKQQLPWLLSYHLPQRPETIVVALDEVCD